MNIKEFTITEYGPLRDKNHISLEKFNLIFGYNESGKTLTVDALIKLLLGKDFDNFKKVNRIEERPLGRICICDENNNDIIIKSNETLKDYFEISNKEFSNLFIIRDSDLNLDKEDQLYGSITNRLLGLRIHDIEKIISTLKDIGRLTPTGKFRDIKNEKLDTKLNLAKTKIEEIDELEKVVKIEKIDELEEELHKLNDQILIIEKDILNLENARKREKFENLNESLTNYEELRNNLKNYENVVEDDKDTWNRNLDRINSKQKEIDDLELENDDLNQTISELDSRLYEKNLEFQKFQKIKDFLDDDIYPEKKNYDIRKGELAGKIMKKKFYKSTFLMCTLSFIGFLIFTIFNPPIYIFIITIILAILSASFWLFVFQIKRDESWLVGFFERMNLKLSKYQLNGAKIEEINNNLANFEFDYAKEKKLVDDLSKEKDNLDEKIKTIQNSRIPNLRKEINEYKAIISTIKKNNKVHSIEEFASKIDEKNQIRNDLELLTKQMAIHVEIIYQNEFELVDRIREELNKFERFKEESIGISYNEDKLDILKNERNDLIDKKELVKTELSSINEDFLQIERDANAILNLEDNYLFCNTSGELKNIKSLLKSFIRENEELKDDILILEEILNEISNEEKEKISRLLSDQSSVIDYFKEITDGMYNFVKYDPENGKIMVQRKDNLLLDAEKVSGGTYDQLYFCIRLALGEKLLQDQTGFFILDDPFLKSDNLRLTAQLKMIKQITQLGWQVLYFTSKNEIKEVLSEDIKKGNVNYIEFEQILS
jgi:hypothetical protein